MPRSRVRAELGHLPTSEEYADCMVRLFFQVSFTYHLGLHLALLRTCAIANFSLASQT